MRCWAQEIRTYHLPDNKQMLYVLRLSRGLLFLNQGGGGRTKLCYETFKFYVSFVHRLWDDCIALQLLNLEACPKNLKTWKKLLYKNDFIPNKVSSQSRDKACTHGLRKCVKSKLPLLEYPKVVF